MVREEEKSRWWWFESHNKTSKHSQWLHSTLAELDTKTKAMLKLIEGNADSFAQRAEIYYKKRPELISFVEDFYRAHRSLAERFDHFKSSDHASRSSRLHLDSNSEFEDAHSEIEDPEEQDQENASSEDETLKLERERLEKLIQESDALRKQLLEKDEEKREVIRQLARTVETLKDENLRLKRRLGGGGGGGGETLNKRSILEPKPIDKFLWKLFYIMCDGNKIV